MMQNRLLRFFFILAICFAYSASAQNSTIIRAAIDVGMGGPKLQIAEIDLYTNKIVKMLHTQRYFVNFYDNLSSNSDNRLSPEILLQGLNAFKDAVAQAQSFAPEGIVAVATAAFRAAANGRQFADKIQNETGIQVHIVDPVLEGKLSFLAVLAKTDIHPEHLVTWDIGGGSMQFVSMALDGTYLTDCKEFGAGAFKDFIIENIQCKNVKEIKSPNPMSAEDVARAGNYANALSRNVSETLKDKIGHPSTIVVGVGSVFGYGIYGMAGNKNPLSIEDLMITVCGLPGKNDADLGGGDFASVEGSNTILALGYMQNLNIKQLRIIHVNNADGALIYKPFWKE